MEKNSVKYLQVNCFTNLSDKEKIEIKNLGRPIPDLNISQSSSSRNHSFLRKFNIEIYYKHRWLCGCNITNALFCFPCLLFSGDPTWTKVGVTDLKHLGEKIKKHENSRKHLKNIINHGMIGKSSIVTSQLNEIYRQQINEHNENVKKNREILSKIIDCIKFFGKYQLPFSSGGADNDDIIKGLLDFSGKLDETLRNHYLNTIAFKESRKKLQNDILQCIFNIYQEEICNEIKQCNYLSIMCEDCSNITENAQYFLIFRYVFDGKIYERFWNFFNIENQNCELLSTEILKELKIVLNGEKEKLISQTYDGTIRINGQNNDIYKIIKENYKYAYFIHNYGHKFQTIMEKTAIQNQKIRLFFTNLIGVPMFFAKSSQRLASLDMILKYFHQDSNPINNINVKLVNKVYESRDILKECFKNLLQKRDYSTVQGATALLYTLNDDDFNFWLEYFNDIMPLADIIDYQLDNINNIQDNIEQFIKILKTESNRLLSSITEEIIPSVIKKRKLTTENIAAAKEFTDYIICQVEERFYFNKYLKAEKLFHPSLFNILASYNPFPLCDLEETIEAYPFLNKERLMNELIVLYERQEFTGIIGLLKIYDIIINIGISEYFTETSKLLKILLTIPMLTTENERCFNTVKQVKTFLRNTKLHDNLSPLAILTLEHEMIDKIINFNEKVIDKFSNLEGRAINFKYK